MFLMTWDTERATIIYVPEFRTSDRLLTRGKVIFFNDSSEWFRIVVSIESTSVSTALLACESIAREHIRSPLSVIEALSNTFGHRRFIFFSVPRNTYQAFFALIPWFITFFNTAVRKLWEIIFFLSLIPSWMSLGWARISYAEMSLLKPTPIQCPVFGDSTWHIPILPFMV